MSSTTARLVALAAVVGLMGAAFTAPVAAAPIPSIPVPQPVPVIAAIGAGGDHSCAVTTAGAVLCWGSNRSGELGDGSTSSVSLPVSVVGLDGPVSAISAGTFQTCALTTGGKVWCWGRGIVYPTNLYPVAVPGLSSGFTAIASGRLHACGLTAAGGVACWGANPKGQLGDGSSTKYAATYLTLVQVTGLTSGVDSIVAGDAYSCAITTTGSVKCWGDNQFGQLGNGTTIGSRVPVDVIGLAGKAVMLAAGGLHVCAILASGDTMCWGRNSRGQLGDGTTLDRLTPVVAAVPAGTTQITAGVLDTCAMGSSGGVTCWGDNTHGELGADTPTGSTSPVAVVGRSTSVVAIAAGDGHTCALLAQRSVTCWGYNGYGQLGNGTAASTFRGLPVTSVDFSVHPSIANLSAAGVTLDGPFTAPTKVAPVGTSITWRAQTLPARAGETVDVWMATRAVSGFTWTAFTRFSSQMLDAEGTTWFAYQSPIAQWVSVQFRLIAHGSDPALTSFARQAHFR